RTKSLSCFRSSRTDGLAVSWPRGAIKKILQVIGREYQTSLDADAGTAARFRADQVAPSKIVSRRIPSSSPDALATTAGETALQFLQFAGSICVKSNASHLTPLLFPAHSNVRHRSCVME